MSDSLYDHDALAWSERQADLLRRLAAGERLNEDVDWTNVIEEIQDVGLAELHTCEILLRKAMVLLLRLRAGPASPEASDWRCEVLSVLADAQRRFSPSMRQRINLNSLYGDAAWQFMAGAGRPKGNLDADSMCPLALDDLIADRPDLMKLLEQLGTA